MDYLLIEIDILPGEAAQLGSSLDENRGAGH
jgi:hypothetical protein